jgi:hypothetical protein
MLFKEVSLDVWVYSSLFVRLYSIQIIW